MPEEARPARPQGPISRDVIAELVELYEQFQYTARPLSDAARRAQLDYRNRVWELYIEHFGEKPEDSPVMWNDFEEQMDKV